MNIWIKLNYLALPQNTCLGETYTNRTGSAWKLLPKLSHSERKPVPSSGTYILDLDDSEVKQYFDDKTNDQRCFVDLRRCNDCWKSIYDVTARPDLAVLIWFICSTCFLAIFNVPILWLNWFISCSIRGTHFGGNLSSFFLQIFVHEGCRYILFSQYFILCAILKLKIIPVNFSYTLKINEIQINIVTFVNKSWSENSLHLEPPKWRR